MNRFLFVLIVVLLGTGCASSPSTEQQQATTSGGDPIEGVNKGVYKFNTSIDKAALKPLAKGYLKVTPGPLKRGISNFFQNLSEPRVMLNSFLQGKIDRGMTSFARFTINTTVGLGGFIDWAKKSGAPFTDEDFGQTLAVWGWKNDNYVMLPFLGPSGIRDGVGTLVDFFTDPLWFYQDIPVRNGLYALKLIDSRSNLLATSDILDTAAGDMEYEFVREAYRQQRQHEIYDGEPPLENLEFLEEEQ